MSVGRDPEDQPDAGSPLPSDPPDSVPPEVTEFAKAALGYRRSGSDLAELVDDSLLGAPDGSTGPVRRLRFRAPDLAIDLEVEAAASGRTLRGRLVPSTGGATIEVERTAGPGVAATEADEGGRFRVTVDGGGRIRLRVARHDSARAIVETSWMTL